MDDLAKADEDRFVAEMLGRFGKRVVGVIRAVNSARTGHLIDDSEGPVLEELRKLGQELYQAAIQSRVDATEAVASFSPSGGIGTGDVRSGEEEPLGTDTAGAGGLDAAAVLEPGGLLGGSGGCVGGPRRGHRERGGAGGVLPAGDQRKFLRAGGEGSAVHRRGAAQR